MPDDDWDADFEQLRGDARKSGKIAVLVQLRARLAMQDHSDDAAAADQVATYLVDLFPVVDRIALAAVLGEILPAYIAARRRADE